MDDAHESYQALLVPDKIDHVYGHTDKKNTEDEASCLLCKIVIDGRRRPI